MFNQLIYTFFLSEEMGGGFIANSSSVCLGKLICYISSE